MLQQAANESVSKTYVVLNRLKTATVTRHFIACTFFQAEFYKVCHTKADYDERGPSICRYNPVFGTMQWFYRCRTPRAAFALIICC